MGSDSYNKSRTRSGRIRRKVAKMTLAVTGLLILLLVRLWFKQLTYAEFEHESSIELATALSLPPQCIEKAQKFHMCQENSKEVSVVFVCHQKWCHSSGHCEICGPEFSFRILHLLRHVTNAAEDCIPMEFDLEPLAGSAEDPDSSPISLPRDVLYHDPMGEIAEVGHFRSYDVSDRKLHRSEWANPGRTFVHILANPEEEDGGAASSKPYDPCYFPILFRPNLQMQREIEIHKSKWGEDMVAIRIADTNAKDTKANDALNKYMKCIESFVSQAMKGSDNNDGLNQRAHSILDEDAIPLFLSTDNDYIREWARTKYSSERYRIYTIDDGNQHHYDTIKNSKLRRQWLELFLLSQSKILVHTPTFDSFGKLLLGIMPLRENDSIKKKICFLSY